MKPSPGIERRRAFTLLELLVVISIITLLMALLMPALKKARDTARQMQCLSHVRQQAMGFTLYANDSDGNWPLIADSIYDSNNLPEAPFENVGLEEMLSPYLVPADFPNAIESPNPTNGVGGKVWNCPSSMLSVKEEASTGVRKYHTQGEVVTGNINAYSGLIKHAQMDKRVDPDVSQKLASWRPDHFTRPSGAPVHWCSLRQHIINGTTMWGSAQPGWHGDDARPTAFVDGHAAVLTKPKYTAAPSAGWQADSLYNATRSVHNLTSPWENGNFAISE